MSRGLGDVYKRQLISSEAGAVRNPIVKVEFDAGKMFVGIKDLPSINRHPPQIIADRMPIKTINTTHGLVLRLVLCAYLALRTCEADEYLSNSGMIKSLYHRLNLIAEFMHKIV